MFKYCPNCKSNTISFDGLKKYVCETCGWTYYQNAATGAMAILTFKGKLLFTIRAKNPEIGKLDFPGGFVDPGESAEHALHRELHEELGLSNLEFQYIGSAVNRYEYKNICYPTCDLIYTSELTTLPQTIDPNEIAEIRLLNPDEIDFQEIGFQSARQAIKIFLNKNHHKA
ncbi:MAG: NUDIX domain-containing protein [Chlorobiales bacterium]|nr:NUDIX domain-containing protein [Chlorobiales bacterium]